MGAVKLALPLPLLLAPDVGQQPLLVLPRHDPKSAVLNRGARNRDPIGELGAATQGDFGVGVSGVGAIDGIIAVLMPGKGFALSRRFDNGLIPGHVEFITQHLLCDGDEVRMAAKGCTDGATPLQVREERAQAHKFNIDGIAGAFGFGNVLVPHALKLALDAIQRGVVKERRGDKIAVLGKTVALRSGNLAHTDCFTTP